MRAKQRSEKPWSTPGGGLLTTRSCMQCGAYGSQRGGAVKFVPRLGRVWVGACCVGKTSGSGSSEGAK